MPVTVTEAVAESSYMLFQKNRTQFCTWQILEAFAEQSRYLHQNAWQLIVYQSTQAVCVKYFCKKKL